jgi:hypothetical protein
MEVIFHEFIKKFFIIYLDGGTIYGPMEKHVEDLKVILNAEANINLDVEKCTFLHMFGVTLEYIVCKQGKLPNPTGINNITNLTSSVD